MNTYSQLTDTQLADEKLAQAIDLINHDGTFVAILCALCDARSYYQLSGLHQHAAIVQTMLKELVAGGTK